jgi:plastocyanin
MSKTVHSVKLQAYDSVDLDRLSYSNGDLVYDLTSGTLRLMDGISQGGRKLATQAWVSGQLLGAKVTVSDTAPSATTNGTLWFNSVSGGIYIYYNGVYIQPSVAGFGGGGGSGTFTGGTVAGATTFTNTVTITGQIRSPASADQNVIAFHFDNQSQFPSASTYHGAIIHSHADARMYMAHGGSWKEIANLTDITNYTLPTASTSVLGGVKIDGVTLAFNGSGQLYYTGGGAGGYTLPTASNSVLGGVKVDGTTVTINGSGVITSNYITYSLPSASTVTLGGVKVDGATITINGSGVITANYSTYTLPTASNSVLGGVKVDASSVTIASGVISVPAVATIGQNNGIATLDGTGKLNTSQIPSSLTGAVVYKGTWNASTNSPTLANGTGTQGNEYAVSVGGTVNFGAGNITFSAGDFVIYSGTVWQQIPGASAVSANALTGTTLASNVVTSSLTTVGTLVNLTVTNTITGSVSGSAGTVTSISGNTLTSGQVTTALGFTPGTAYTLPAATPSALGGVIIPVVGTSGISNSLGTIILATASTTQLGGVKVDGSTITINGSGVISASTSYSLPTATTSVLGGVKVDGSTITINGSGVISSAASSIPTYPAITRLDVTNSGASAYLFSNQYSGNNPTIYAISGTTIAFNLNVLGHPFLIRQSGANFDTGLIHVSTTGTVSTGTSAQGQTSGTLYWQIPQASAGAFAYQCSIHAAMVGVITVKQISSLP